MSNRCIDNWLFFGLRIAWFVIGFFLSVLLFSSFCHEINQNERGMIMYWILERVALSSQALIRKGFRAWQYDRTQIDKSLETIQWQIYAIILCLCNLSLQNVIIKRFFLFIASSWHSRKSWPRRVLYTRLRFVYCTKRIIITETMYIPIEKSLTRKLGI